ncbi:hypothetical protein C3747_7g456 [Trypanosoma cruzi]|uniref:Uncharacterized protein n=2 Tax=Trypanosoma cruzi TaxID=5693 RepID=Q4CZK5_TRYCC|nr:hypothetical protein, conserved [Trypanosoma cruzi]EAN85704.1 hypothetical protein, conserved [Trypanosoma cruzi]PWV20118.1 hypothetical protein C3747_7g456 [Trypanosoma cruzi]RNC43144.1 hypothetical protein TcCL_NonESM07185 [Trypanosoma cruzi]|eukprot:XP_807555.1 hypothetical protein [Trypanosoma cruzi strain CL Brener]
MFCVGSTKLRQAVALFTIKSFRARQKILLTPQNLDSVFTEKLDPQDRLLRQSSVGPGASRILVLDKNQRVRGVYHPLLCLPYPLNGDGVLGIPVESYLQRIQQKKQSNGDSTEGCTFIVVAHANGLGIAVYAADGNACFPLVNVKLPAQRCTGRGMMNERDMIPFIGTTSLVEDFAEIMAENYSEYIHFCSTFFFLANPNTSISFHAMRSAWKLRGYTDTSPLSFTDNRWVPLPDLVAQRDPSVPLYCRDDGGDKVVSIKGLTAGVKVGMLELDT